MKLLIYTQVVDANDPILGFFVSWIRTFSKDFSAITVICLRKGRYELPSHVTVLSLGKEEGVHRWVYLFRLYRYLWRYTIANRVEYVFFHMGAIANVLALPFFLLRRWQGTRFLWWKTYGHLTTLDRMALGCVDAVYTAVPESFPIDSVKRKVVGHAIDTTLFALPTQKERDTTLLFVGRISRVKRIEQVIEVARLVAERGQSIKVRIVGEPIDVTYSEELMARTKELRLESIITFVGGLVQEEVVHEYQNAMVP